MTRGKKRTDIIGKKKGGTFAQGCKKKASSMLSANRGSSDRALGTSEKKTLREKVALTSAVYLLLPKAHIVDRKKVVFCRHRGLHLF